METVLKTYDEISKDEMYQILRLRAEVFIVEQESPYQDLDDLDQISYHLIAYENGSIAGYIRIIPEKDDAVHIGRVIAVKRRCGLGTLMMKRAIDFIRKELHPAKIEIEAQSYVKEFYSGLGFVQISDEYVLDRVPHMRMELIL